MNLAKVDEIKSAISALSHDEALYLWDWFSEKEWSEWDAQLEADSLSGKLDFLIEEAFSEKSQNKLKAL
jgi:hypothetical protein